MEFSHPDVSNLLIPAITPRRFSLFAFFEYDFKSLSNTLSPRASLDAVAMVCEDKLGKILSLCKLIESDGLLVCAADT